MTALLERAEQVATPDPVRPHVRWRNTVVAAGLPTLATAFHASYYGEWIVDDAGLSFAYARSLAEGAGPVLQPGATPVEGYSNPAWVLLLVVGRWIGLFDRGTILGVPDIVLFPKLVGVICCFGIFAAMYAIATRLTRRPILVTIVAGTLTASVPSFAIWTTSGLENALFAAVVVGLAATLVCAVLDDRLLDTTTAVTAGCLTAVAALTRPDGIIYIAVMPIITIAAVRRTTVRATIRANLLSIAVCAIPVGAYLTWRVATFGDFLPNTARAKEQQLPSMAGLDRVGELTDYIGIVPTCVGAAIVIAALWRPSRTRIAIAVLLVPLGLAVAALVMLQPDWMVQLRFATPIWPLAAVMVTLSVAQIIRSSSLRVLAVTSTLSIVAALACVGQFAKWHSAFLAHPTVGVCNVAQSHGYLFNGYADILGIREGSLLGVDGGGTSLTTRLNFVDLSGLADRQIAQFWQRDDMPGLRHHIFDEVRPTFIKVFAFWAERERLALADDPRMGRDYVLVFAGAPNSAEWVRRDAVTDRAALRVAREWARASWNLANSRYPGGTPPVWWCGDALRPTPFKDGAPARSPLTEE